MISDRATYQRGTQIYPNFQSAYIVALARVYDDPEFENSPRGQYSREILGLTYQIEDPIQRHIELPARKANIVFCFAELLWYLSKSDSLSDISYYAPGIKQYSADGVTLSGTAYGPRIFRSGQEQVNQWAAVRKELRRDSDSKRAVMSIYEPREALIENNIDVACTLALQFLIRDGELHCQSFMRANDAFVGVVSDVFSFTALQEIMACELGLKVGRFTHCVGSYHLYMKNRDRAYSVLREAGEGTDVKLTFPAMPRVDNWHDIKVVTEYAADLRKATRSPDSAPVGLGVHEYWRQVATLFYLNEQRLRGQEIDVDAYRSLVEVYRVLLAQKWPTPFESIH
jgi:thymidylate synthase